MKKLVVLLVSVLSFSAATFAQQGYDRRNNNDRYESPYYKDGYKGNSNDRFDDRNYSKNNRDRYDRDRRMEMEQINREYDERIRQYRNDRRISSYEESAESGKLKGKDSKRRIRLGRDWQ